MPHLHLPTAHTDADLVLAANLADIVGSEDLFVAWTHESGPGAVPEIEAYVRDERPSALTHLIASVVSGAMAIWQGLTRPSARPVAPAAAPRQHAA